MEVIDGHIIDKSLLKDNDWILDAGCRGFRLKEKLKGNYRFLCIDPDPEIQPIEGVEFEHVALMTYQGEANYCGWSTGEGNYCYKEQAPWFADRDFKVKCTTIKALMEKYKIDQFGLAKIDIEGAEYDFFLSIDFPFARQITVEIHDCMGYNPYGTHGQYIDKLMSSKFGEIYMIYKSYEYTHVKGIYEYNFILNGNNKI